jgi:hypothetical protein
MTPPAAWEPWSAAKARALLEMLHHRPNRRVLGDLYFWLLAALRVVFCGGAVRHAQHYKDSD